MAERGVFDEQTYSTAGNHWQLPRIVHRHLRPPRLPLPSRGKYEYAPFSATRADRPSGSAATTSLRATWLRASHSSASGAGRDGERRRLEGWDLAVVLLECRLASKQPGGGAQPTRQQWVQQPAGRQHPPVWRP